MACSADDYLAYVHKIDHSPLEPNPAMGAAIAKLPGRKLILTNGSTDHAGAVLERLGIGQHFEAVFDIIAAELEPKPAPQTYQKFLSVHGVDPAKSAMFEDLARNLVVPHQLGMTTVLVVPDGAKEVVREDWELEGRDAAYVDHVTDDLTGFLQGLGISRPRPSCPASGLQSPSTLDELRRVRTPRSRDDECALTLPRQIPKKPSKPRQSSRSEEIPMSLSALESTVNAAFDARDGISTATKGEVREAVDHALELLDKGEARVAEREAERQMEGQSVAEEGGAAVVPPQRHGRRFPAAPAWRRGGTRCPRSSKAGARTVFATPVFARCPARSCAARPSSPATSC